MRFSFPVTATMVAAPCLMLGTVAATARIDNGSYAYPGYGPGLHKDFLEYSRVIQEAGDPASANDATHYRAAEKALDTWNEGFESGRLRLIPAANSDDIGEAGTRYELNRSKRGVVRHAIHEALILHRIGQDRDAGRLLGKAFQLSRRLREASPRALSESAQDQLDLTNAAVKVAPKLSVQERASLAKFVSTAPMSTTEMKENIDRFIRHASPSHPKAAVQSFDSLVVRKGIGKPLPLSDVEDAQSTTRWWALNGLRNNAKLKETVDEALPVVAGKIQGPGIFDRPTTAR